jgi:hypothetical protein
MLDLLAVRDVQIFVTCIAVALCIAWLATRKVSVKAPVWPVRFYLFVLLMGPLQRYAKGRHEFSRREQFLASFAVWFFILFVVGIALFACGRRGC